MWLSYNNLMRKKPLCAHVTREIIPQHLQPHRCFLLLLLLLLIIIPVREEPGRAPHSLFLRPAAARLSSAPRGTDERCGIAPHDRDMLGFALVAGSVWFVLGEWESSEGGGGGGALCSVLSRLPRERFSVGVADAAVFALCGTRRCRARASLCERVHGDAGRS